MSIDGTRRQCGICAACLLRRLSVHAAGLSEPPDTYVWESLTASTFDGGASVRYDRKKITSTMHHYAVAGVLHLEHLAELAEPSIHSKEVEFHAIQLASACRLAEPEARGLLGRLFSRHANEWTHFVDSLGSDSFVSKLISGRNQR